MLVARAEILQLLSLVDCRQSPVVNRYIKVAMCIPALILLFGIGKCLYGVARNNLIETALKSYETIMYKLIALCGIVLATEWSKFVAYVAG